MQALFEMRNRFVDPVHPENIRDPLGSRGASLPGVVWGVSWKKVYSIPDHTSYTGQFVRLPDRLSQTICALRKDGLMVYNTVLVGHGIVAVGC